SLVARGLALLWDTSRFEKERARGILPAELLDLFHEELETLLWRVHIAAVIGRFDPDGVVHVSYAGDCRCLRARPGAPIEINTEGGSLRGPSLTERHQDSWRLQPLDEVAFVTDGFLDQPDHTGSCLDRRVIGALVPETSCLHVCLETFHGDALAHHPQFDDTT